MLIRPNHEIRETMKKLNVYAWQVADQLGVHENTLFRLLCKELSKEKKEQITVFSTFPFVATITLTNNNPFRSW